MINKVLSHFSNYLEVAKTKQFEHSLGFLGKGAYIHGPITCSHPENIFIYDYSHLVGPFRYIGIKGKFILKHHSCGVQGLTVITGAHNRMVGKFFNGDGEWEGRSYDLDIIVEEDVWIGANVTLLAGVVVGRGASIGAGSVVRNSVPPYAIVTGNPGKIVGFCYTPEEIIEHEKALFPEAERLSIEFLERNYEKFFLKRLKEIKEFTKL